jgi:hypothetical protein
MNYKICLLHFMPLHNFYFILMCSFRFYFANRNRLKFKLHLDSNWFAFIKRFVKGKAFSFSWPHGPKPTAGPAGFALPYPTRGPAEAHAAGLVAQQPYRISPPRPNPTRPVVPESNPRWSSSSNRIIPFLISF